MKKSIHSHSLAATQKIANELAKTILEKKKGKGAFVLALKGELGSGKTSFVQGLAKGLGAGQNVLSPTFLIAKSYPLVKKRTLWHIDCYRLKGAKELIGLGWKEIIEDPCNIVAIEWADKVKSIIPKDALWLFFSHAKKGLTQRDITIG
jgi:tRNA threonylcarbamoyladenosine biosynthesis protein TsaE